MKRWASQMLSKRTLNGWRRVWVVVSAAALFYAVVWAFGNVPYTDRVDDKVLSGYGNPQCRHVVQMPATSKLDPEPEYENPCWALYIYRHLYENAAMTSDGYIKNIEGRRREALLISLGVALAMWLVGVSLLYAAGVVVAWVRKGFARSTEPQ